MPRQSLTNSTTTTRLDIWKTPIVQTLQQQQQRRQPVPKLSVFHRIGPPRRVEKTPRPSNVPSTSNGPRLDNTKQKEKERSSKKEKKREETRKSSKESNKKKGPSLPTPPATPELESNEILLQKAVQELDDMDLEIVFSRLFSLTQIWRFV